LDLLATIGASSLLKEMESNEMLEPQFLANGDPDILVWPGEEIGQLDGDFVLSYGYRKTYLGIGKIVKGEF